MQTPFKSNNSISDKYNYTTHNAGEIDYNFTFHSVSLFKLVILNIFTFGIYQMHWFYKNWMAIKKAGKKCSPGARGFFAYLFAFSLFTHIKNSMLQNLGEANFPSAFLAIVYFFLALPTAPKTFGLLCLLSIVPVAIANHAALKVSQKIDPAYVADDNFTLGSWLAIAAGWVFIAFFYYYYFLNLR